MKYIEGIPRAQLVLFSDQLDDIIEKDNPVRMIDDFVENLDMEKLGFKIPNYKLGAPCYRRELLLKIYVYGYMNKIRSSRKLEKTCKINNEMIWLTCGLSPDFKTIADFRKNNIKGLKNLYKFFLFFCKELNLIDFKNVSGDGTKIKGNNGYDNIYKRKDIIEQEKRINDTINQYINELDINDSKEAHEYNPLSKKALKNYLNLKKKKAKIESIKQVFDSNPDLDIYFANDNDARFQKDKGRKYAGYNCQNIVDKKNKLIVVAEATKDSNDRKQLKPLINKIQKIKKDLKITNKTTASFDAGYHCEIQLLAVKDTENIDIYVSHPRDAKKSNIKYRNHSKEKLSDKIFTIDDFKYNEKKNQLVCPSGEKINTTGRCDKKDGIERYIFRCKKFKNCDLKSICSRSKREKVIRISKNYSYMLKYRKKSNSVRGIKILKERKSIAEQPFSFIKYNLGYDTFSLTGLDKVDGEYKFISFIYNFKRVMNIIPMKKLIQIFKSA